MHNTLDLFTEADTHRLVDHIKTNMIKGMPLALYVDLFCGAGGHSTGLIDSNPNAFVVACVNHDPTAILSHHKNHPQCIHYTEDIRDFGVIEKIKNLLEILTNNFPDAHKILHASLECIHFSKAKGGQSRDADSRTLADDLMNYLVMDFDYITIENVEEFKTWGPLTQKIRLVDNTGITYEYVKTTQKSKKRYSPMPYYVSPDYYDNIGYEPVMVPDKTKKGIYYKRWIEKFKEKGYKYDHRMLNAADYGQHTSRVRYFGIFAKQGFDILFPAPTHNEDGTDGLKKHKAVREVLDLENHGVSIFGFNKKGKKYSDNTVQRSMYGLLKFHGHEKYIIKYRGGKLEYTARSINKPITTILTNNTHSVVTPVHTSSYYGASNFGQGVHSLDEPLNTIPTKERHALHHVQHAYSNACYGPIEKPLNTITIVPKAELVTGMKADPWLWDTQFNNIGRSIDRPGPTIIARQDKKPLYISSVSHHVAPPFVDQSIPQPNDTPAKAELRAVMRELGFTDLYIRSLTLMELKRAQGFAEDYILEGGKTKALKYVGNSVCPKVAQAIGESIYQGLLNYKQAA